MNWKIHDADGNHVNTIFSGEAFVARYCNLNGYTYEAEERKPKPTAEEQIAALKAGLEATDYKIIKCSEYQLAGLELPYDVAALHAERQALRDKINALEAEA